MPLSSIFLQIIVTKLKSFKRVSIFIRFSSAFVYTSLELTILGQDCRRLLHGLIWLLLRWRLLEISCCPQDHRRKSDLVFLLDDLVLHSQQDCSVLLRLEVGPVHERIPDAVQLILCVRVVKR